MKPLPLSFLRKNKWAGVPSSPGVYWWYFPLEELKRLRIAEFCDAAQLRFRQAPQSKLCLYHGMANNLAQRVEWHAAQKLTPSCLKSGFLSTFRFTLLAMIDFDYLSGTEQIDRYFDTLSISWQSANSRAEAAALERAELRSGYHYPLNIQGSHQVELARYVRHLKSTRKTYKERYIN
jgi:hypothetical protein